MAAPKASQLRFQTVDRLLSFAATEYPTRNPSPMSASRGPVFSFRTILFLIALAGVLPAIIFSGILLKRFAEDERLRAERALINSTRGIARGIDAQFNAAEAAILALSNSILLDAGNLPEFEKRLRRTAAETGRDFTLTDIDGRQIINTLLPEGQQADRDDPAVWAPVFFQRRTVISNVIEGRVTKRLFAAVAVPVIRSGAVKWALAGRLYSKDFTPVMDEP